MATRNKGKSQPPPAGRAQAGGGRRDIKAEAERNPQGRPLSGRDPRFHSPDSLERPAPAPAPRRRYRWLLTAVPAVMALLMVTYIGFWIYTAVMARRGFETWVADRRAEGYQVSFSELAVEGFPLRVKVRLETPSLTAPEALGGWSWSSPRAQAEIFPLTPSTFTLDARGPHALRLPFGGTLVPVGIGAAQMTAQMALDGAGRLERTEITGKDLRIDGLAPESLRIGTFSLRTLNGALYGDSPKDEVTGSLMLAATDITPPSGLRLGLAPKIERVGLDLRAFGKLPPGRWADALPAWRDNRGGVRVDGLALDWKPFTLRASGSFSLDKSLQPEGSLSAQTDGLFPLIEGLARQGWVGDAEAGVARLLIAGFARGSTTFNLPVSVRGGRLFLGTAPLARVPALPWGKGEKDPNRIAPGFEINRDGKPVRPNQPTEEDEQ
ncbi:DUF2125 domain-containing protein [Pararhodospirillum photometricum]|nr:DUF2125 domain-containing protein [Pararhodospirillum photometricum]